MLLAANDIGWSWYHLSMLSTLPTKSPVLFQKLFWRFSLVPTVWAKVTSVALIATVFPLDSHYCCGLSKEDGAGVVLYCGVVMKWEMIVNKESLQNQLECEKSC